MNTKIIFYGGKMKSMMNLMLGAILMIYLIGGVNAYSGGGGTCNCGDGTTTLGGNATNACVDCTAALNDNTNCTNQVDYVGTVAIDNYDGTCINNPSNFNNKIFDCQGFTIDGNGTGNGISTNGPDNSTIKNCIITGFIKGISIQNGDFWILVNNSVNNNTADGIRLSVSDNNTLTNNTVINNQYGFSTTSSSTNNALNSNTFCSNTLQDINNAGTNNTGNNNTCSNADNWNDTGTTGCTHPCITCGCVGATTTFVCGGTVDESCTLNCHLTSNSTCFAIEANNITIDGAGYSITGDTTGEGIYVTGRNNVAIKNFNIYNFSYGIYLEYSSNNTLTNNTVSSNDYIGIHLEYSSNNNITNNTANSNNFGISLWDCTSNIIADNTVNSNWEGIPLHYSSNNTLTKNTVNSNYIGISLNSSASNIFTNNTANSNNYTGINLYSNSDYNNLINNNITNTTNTGVYFSSDSNDNNLTSNSICGNDYDIHDDDLNSGDNNTCNTTEGWNDTGTTGCTYTCGVAPVDCSCSTCGECKVKLNNPACAVVALTTNIYNHSGTCINNPVNFSNKVFDCQGHTIDGAGSDEGINIAWKSGNTIKNCNVRDYHYGVSLYYSTNNTIINNNVNSNNYLGINLERSSNNTLINNNVNSNNHHGIYLHRDSSNNNLTSNNVSSNNHGIYMGLDSNSNTLTNNTVNDNNEYGILLDNSSNNKITNNTVQENTKYDIIIYAVSDDYCNNVIKNNTGSGDREIKVFNHSINLGNEIISELILCNADHSNINNVTVIGSGSLRNNGILVSRTDNSNFTNIDSSNNYIGINLYSNSDYNNLINNNITNNTNTGVYFSSDSNNNNLTENLVCGNGLDINDTDSNDGDVSDDNNTCNTTDGWNDYGATGCSNSCPNLSYAISVIPPSTTVYVNQTFNITVNISGTNIVGAGFDLMFNNTILEALNIYEGSFIGQCANTTYPVPSPVINNTAGNVSFQDMCWGGETISGTGDAAVITFKALSEGISDILLYNAVVFDSEGNATPGVVVENGTVEVVSNIPPDAEPGMDRTAYTNQVLQFNGSNSTDSDGNIISYFWDFGDTNNAAGVALTHTYTSPGTYTVNLTVTDDDGAEDSDILTVTVYLAGDVNHDECVNIYDLAKIAVAGDSMVGDSRFNPDADFNNDGTIDFDDLALLAANWKKCV